MRHVTVSSLSKSFGTQQVLNQISLHADLGQCVALLGKNGAGKSTLFNCLLDLLQPDSGEIIISGLGYATQPMAIKRMIGVVSEENPLIPEFTGWQHLEFVGLLHDVPKDELQHRIETVFDFFFEKRTDLNKNIRTYSTGMKKKLALCAAVLHRPTILVLDEPFSGLDVFAARQVVRFLQFYLSGSCLMLLSSHDFSYVNQVATHVAVLHDKGIVFYGTIREFTEDGSRRMDESLFRMLALTEEMDMHSLAWLKEG